MNGDLLTIVEQIVSQKELPQSVLIHVSGGPDMTLKEARQIMKTVVGKLDPNARIIWGATIEKSLREKIRVMLILSGLKDKKLVRYKATGVVGAEVLAEDKEKKGQFERSEQVLNNGSNIFDIKDSIIASGTEISTQTKPIKPITQTTLLFYRIFEEEASGDLKRFERAVHLLRQNSDNRRALLDAKQACKLLFASSQMFGFDEIGQLIASIEEILSCVQSREIQMTLKILDSITLAMEMVVDLIEKKSDGRGETGYIVDRLRELKEEKLTIFNPDRNLRNL